MDIQNQYIALISRYLSNQSSVDEEQLLFEWVRKNKLNEEQFEEFKKAWELSKEKTDPEINKIDLNEEWNKFELKIADNKEIKLLKKEKSNRFSMIQMAASITILVLIASGLYFLLSPSKTTLIASNTIQENALPDGSLVSLNHYSSITYTNNYNRKNRKILLKGEAFFKVEPNKSKPFIVETGKLYIEVMGTSFNIKNTEYGENIEVTVESGKVKLYSQINNKDSLLLIAGESAKFNKNLLKINKSNNRDTNYLAWKTKIFNFEEATLEHIIETLNQCYNSNIIIKDNNIKQCTVTVSFSNQSIESILKVLKATLEIQVEQKNNVFEITGNGCGDKGFE